MSEDKEILPFYLELKEKREIENLDINKISEETKINIKHLMAIESGDFNIIPNTYLRLFIKTYAQYLKLDYQEILNKYESESNKKGENIFKKKTIKKINKESISIKKSISNFKLSESYYLEPKKIIQIIILFSFLASIYLLVSYLSKKQAEIVDHNTTILNEEAAETISIDENTLLNSSDFKNKNLIKSESFKLNKEIGTEYTFQISTKEKTKIYISFNDDDEKRIEKCNIVADKGELIKYTFSNNIYFDLLSAKHVQVSINNNSINKYLGKKDYSIRGSFEPLNKQLYLEFYSK
tara:strand:- start:27601 stop:28485 length:885 start_codon:yes stop_codon:yes gene_type:complete